MSEEINKILDKFDRTLEEYELDKKVGQPSIDSIYFLYPSEMITIKNYIRQKENIIKEVREYIEENFYQSGGCVGGTDLPYSYIEELLEILDKVGDEK